jgi:phosphoribosylamine--glycine ligase
MGSVSPGTHHGRVGLDETTLLARVHDQVMIPVLAEMRGRGMPFVGVLFAGLMVDPATGNFRVLEFNARLGDPETQVMLRRVDGNLANAMLRCCEADATGVTLGILPQAAACVVMAAHGYPGQARQNDVINGLAAASALESVKVFHAATVLKDGAVVTRGGRVLGVSATGETAAHALERAYSACALITWPGVQFRRDIGRNTL